MSKSNHALMRQAPRTAADPKVRVLDARQAADAELIRRLRSEHRLYRVWWNATRHADRCLVEATDAKEAKATLAAALGKKYGAHVSAGELNVQQLMPLA